MIIRSVSFSVSAFKFACWARSLAICSDAPDIFVERGVVGLVACVGACNGRNALIDDALFLLLYVEERGR